MRIAVCDDDKRIREILKKDISDIIPDAEIISGFYFGTGIGNAIFINGHPLTGKNGTAGELGHIPSDGSTKVCGCGNVGCMESLAGGKYLAELVKTIYLYRKEFLL